MKIRTLIDNIAGRYNVQVETFDFSAVEQQKMTEFGEPLVDVGGNFSGTISRPGETDTTLTVNGSHSTLATMTPVILTGVITGVAVTNPGEGYGTATITITGDGTGANLTPLYGVVAVGSIVAPGSAYLLNDIVTYGVGDPVVIKITGVDGGGGVTSYTILSAGKLSATAAGTLAAVGGTGTGFTFDVTAHWGVTGATVVAGGSDYNEVPTTVTFTLPPAPRRLMTDSPFKQIFDLRDSEDSDVMARVWADTIVSRLTTAKNALIGLSSPFEGETVVTV